MPCRNENGAQRLPENASGDGAAYHGDRFEGGAGDITCGLGKRRDRSEERGARRGEQTRRKKGEEREETDGEEETTEEARTTVEGGSTAARRATAEPKGHSEEQRR